MAEKPSIGFVLTNYNNSFFTRLAVQSINRFSDPDRAMVVVVDNASSESEFALLESVKLEYPKTVVLANKKNLGYFAGLNCGIDYIRDREPNIGALVVGNNDLIFPTKFLELVDACYDTLQKFPVLCPDIITLDGTHQNPHVISKISPFREFIWDIYYSNFQLSRAILRLVKIFGYQVTRKDSTNYKVAGSIAQGYGACYVLSPLFFSLFEGLWSPSFLMGEEFFLRLQIQSIGYKCYYEPRIVVEHQDHATCDRLPSKVLWRYARESHKVYRKFVKFPRFIVPGGVRLQRMLKPYCLPHKCLGVKNGASL